jgi:hypothetical protein
VTFNEGLLRISYYAFSGCGGITELTFKEGLSFIGDCAFQDCASLAALELNRGLTTISNYAFSGCTKLSGNLVIPDSVAVIGAYAFNDCSALNGTLALGAGLGTIGEYAFQNCNKMTGDLIIPDSVTSLGRNAFYNCSGFNGKLRLSANLTAINTYAFYGCSGLKGELTIPDKVGSAADYAFGNMNNITSFIFGTGFTAFLSGSLNGCTGVLEMTFKGLTVPTVITFSGLTSLQTVYVPPTVYDAYVAAYTPLVREGVVFTIDTLRMAVPNLQAERVYSKSAYLTWSQHVSPDVVKYVVTRDGSVIGETTDLFFADRNLETGQSYSYQVYGVAADSRESGKTTITCVTAPPAINSIETGNEQGKIGLSKNTITIETVNSKNYLPLGSDTVKGLLYYLDNGAEHLIGQAVMRAATALAVVYTIDWNVESIPEGEYTVLFRITDVDGVSAARTGNIIVDHSRPEKIINVIALGDKQA